MLELTHRDELPALIAKRNPNAVIVEIGVYRGDYLAKFAEALPRGMCYGVDSWLDHLQGRNRTTPTDKSAAAELVARDRFQSVANVQLIRQDSAKAAQRFADESLDLIYVDADHTFDGCVIDLQTWYPKLKRGGIFAGHDYMQHRNGRVTFGVIEAVNMFAAANQLHINVTQDHPPSWMAVKP